MKTVFRWAILSLLVCSFPIFAQDGRKTSSAQNNKPLYIDGVRYDARVADLFKDQVQYTVVERDAIYGFTSPEGVQAFGRERPETTQRPLTQ